MSAEVTRERVNAEVKATITIAEKKKGMIIKVEISGASSNKGTARINTDLASKLDTAHNKNMVVNDDMKDAMRTHMAKINMVQANSRAMALNKVASVTGKRDVIEEKTRATVVAQAKRAAGMDSKAKAGTASKAKAGTASKAKAASVVEKRDIGEEKTKATVVAQASKVREDMEATSTSRVDAPATLVDSAAVSTQTRQRPMQVNTVDPQGTATCSLLPCQC